MNAGAPSKDDPTNLESIRQTLIRLEDTIIFLLIERAQFAHNSVIYEDSNQFVQLKVDHETSFLGWILRQTETIHAKVRRYESPDEYPFTPRQELPEPILPPFKSPTFLYPNNINVNRQITQFYVDQIVRPLTNKPGGLSDDGHYGSSAVRDVEILQAVSRRIHYGKFVAECKFRAHPHSYIPHIQSSNSAELENLITVPSVEVALLHRLEAKARMYGQEVDITGVPINGAAQNKEVDVMSHSINGRAQSKMDAEVVVRMYRDWVIPLTRHVEVEYLLHRLDGLSQEAIDELTK